MPFLRRRDAGSGRPSDFIDTTLRRPDDARASLRRVGSEKRFPARHDGVGDTCFARHKAKKSATARVSGALASDAASSEADGTGVRQSWRESARREVSSRTKWCGDVASTEASGSRITLSQEWRRSSAP